MPSYTQTEFAELINKKLNYVGEYIKRGKLKLSGSKIDTSIEPNKSWLAKYQEKNPEIFTKAPVPAPAPPAKPGKKTTTANPPAETTTTEQPKNGKDASFYQLEKDKLALTNEKLTNENALLIKKLEKMEGELIPTELCLDVVKRLGVSIYTAFENATDTLMNEIEKKTRMDSKTKAGYRKKIVDIINAAVDESQELALKEIENIANEYSDTRGKGEKK